MSTGALRVTLGVLVVVALVLGGVDWCASRPPSTCDIERFHNDRGADWAGPKGGPVVTVVGDSWSVGGALPKPSVQGWPYRLAERTGWRVRVAGYAGSGYLAPGACGDTYAERARAIPTDSRLVLFEGGINDAASHPQLAGLSTAVSEAVAAARYRAPGAQVIVLGLPTIEDLGPAASRRLNAHLKAGAEKGGAAWLAAPGTVSLYWDGVHPTPRGHREYAQNAAALLSQRDYETPDTRRSISNDAEW